MTGSLVVRKSTHVTPFSRDILFTSLYDSLRHRKTAINDATALTVTVIAKLLGQIHSAEIDRDAIATETKAVLQRFDKAAAVHYAAYHPLSTS